MKKRADKHNRQRLEMGCGDDEAGAKWWNMFGSEWEAAVCTSGL